MGVLARTESKYSPFWPPQRALGEVPPSPAAAAAMAGLPPERREVVPGLPPAEPPALAPMIVTPGAPATRPRAIERFAPLPAEPAEPAAAARGDIESLSVEVAALRDQNRLILDRLARIEELLRARGV